MSTNTTNQNGQSGQKQVTVLSEKTLADAVLSRVQSMQAGNAITLPPNYSPENALKSAYLMLLEAKDKDNKPVLQVCNQNSIANALLDMVVQGLNPMKKQCYFIAYGDKLTMQRSYMGTVAVSKRVAGVKDVQANIIYEGDDFQYEINPDNGRIKIIQHKQKIEDINPDKIKGAYAVLSINDGTTIVEVMNITQIRRAWDQGQMKGKSGAHTGFTDQMAKKTVIGRACKLLINSSDDAGLFFDDENNTDYLKREANTEVVETTFEDVTPVAQPEPKVGTAEQVTRQEPVAAEAKTNPGF